MSGELHRLTFAVTTADLCQWSAEDLVAAGDDAPHRLVEQLAERMVAAGNAFLAEHPDAFRGEVT